MHRVSAVGQCKSIDCAAEAMNDSAFGVHLAGQIDPRGPAWHRREARSQTVKWLLSRHDPPGCRGLGRLGELQIETNELLAGEIGVADREPV
jgi:hypothetical protein